jgi:hypothetical protein
MRTIQPTHKTICNSRNAEMLHARDLITRTLAEAGIDHEIELAEEERDRTRIVVVKLTEFGRKQ